MKLSTPRSKNQLKPWLKQMWCIPPQEDARFVVAIEEVLEFYSRSYDVLRPVVCLVEDAKQILGEIRDPLTFQLSRPQRYYGEYERRGTCSLFMLFEPLVAECCVRVRERHMALAVGLLPHMTQLEVCEFSCQATAVLA